MRVLAKVALLACMACLLVGVVLNVMWIVIPAAVGVAVVGVALQVKR
jgi:xanthosine utilization system XapX-like protein